MKYFIACTCGENVSVEAEGEEDAVQKLIPAMDGHLAARPHPNVLQDMSSAQKEGMVRSRMQKEP